MQSLLRVSHGLGGGASTWSHADLEEQALLVEVNAAGSYSDHFEIKIRIFETTFELELSLQDTFSLINNIKFKSLQLDSLPFMGGSKYLEFLRELSEYMDKIKDKTLLTLIAHDYYSICPSYNLINSHGKFCNVPSIETCRNCLKSNIFIDERYSETDIDDWRIRNSKLMSSLHKIYVLSELSETLIRRTYPNLEEKVFKRIVPVRINNSPKKDIGTGLSSGIKIMSKVHTNKKVRVLFLGDINYAKGSEIIRSLLEINDNRNQFAFELLGSTDLEGTIRGLTNYGRYSRHDLNDELHEINPDIIMIPSIWPETYGFVADEVIGSGFKFIAFDFGGIYERFANHSNAHFVKLIDPLQIYNEMLSISKSIGIEN